jgi:hypothetical protein
VNRNYSAAPITNGAPQQRLVVIDEDVKVGAATPGRTWLSAKATVIGIADHDQRPAYGNLAMQDPTVGLVHPEEFLRAERLLVEGDPPRRRRYRCAR